MWNVLKQPSRQSPAWQSGHQNTVSFLLLCLQHTTHTFVGLAFFCVGGILAEERLSSSRGTFLSVQWRPCTVLSVSLPRSISTACIRCTLNLKWSIVLWPEFAHHIFYKHFLFASGCNLSFCKSQHATDKQQLSAGSQLAISDRAKFFTNVAVVRLRFTHTNLHWS